jgi:hypothetical protein
VLLNVIKHQHRILIAGTSADDVGQAPPVRLAPRVQEGSIGIKARRRPFLTPQWQVGYVFGNIAGPFVAPPP